MLFGNSSAVTLRTQAQTTLVPFTDSQGSEVPCRELTGWPVTRQLKGREGCRPHPDYRTRSRLSGKHYPDIQG
jgi:hypothetical protein